MRSIKTQLTRDWLIIGCLLVASVVLAIYGFTQMRARQVMDQQLQQLAHLMVVHDLAGDSMADDDQLPMPHNLMVRQWRIGASTAYVSHPEQFKIPFDLPQGYSTVQIKAAGMTSHLRVYTLEAAGSMIQVAAPLTERDTLSRELAETLIAPVILILLFFMGVFRWRMRQALAPLQRLHEEIAERKNGWKTPLDASVQPVELVAPVNAINQLVNQLLRNLQTQQHFIADAAHELRTPLTALRLQLGNLKQNIHTLEDAKPKSAKTSAPLITESLSEMGMGIDRAARLVEQLLQLARLQHQGQAHHRERVDIVPLIRDTLAHMAYFSNRAQMELAYEGPSRAKAWVFAFSLRILLENLIQNACKYGQPGTTVTVRLRRDDGQAAAGGVVDEANLVGWSLEVCNEGAGIDPEWHERAFERFFRLSEHQNMPGSGLGLAIVREIALLHESEVQLRALHPDAAEPGLVVAMHLPFAED